MSSPKIINVVTEIPSSISNEIQRIQDSLNIIGFYL
jgi:hypothetical protein